MQPVAGPVVAGPGNRLVAVQFVGVQHGEGRLFAGRPHVDEYQPLVLMGRIGPVAEAVFEGAVGGFAGGFEYAAVHVEQPAVVAAAYAMVADDAELKGSAAVGTVEFHGTDVAALVLEENQVFAKNPHSDGQVFEFVGHEDGLPETAEILTARSPRPHPRQFVVGLGHLPMVVGPNLWVRKGARVVVMGGPPLLTSLFSTNVYSQGRKHIYGTRDGQRKTRRVLSPRIAIQEYRANGIYLSSHGVNTRHDPGHETHSLPSQL